MNRISTETAVEGLCQALEWEPVRIDQIFDAIALRLHRLPAFADMRLDEIDLLLADVRRDAADDVGELEERLIDAFRNAIFDGADA